MATGIEPITLPWKRPEKGVSAAELGASFRIEQREDGWHCTVRVGRRSEVLVTGMRRLRDAQCRAEAHAATLPEVAAALAEASKAAAKGGSPVPQGPRAEASAGRAAKPPTVPTRRPGRAPTFEQVSDGCICGKIDGGTWIADPAGKVSVPAGTDPVLAQEICRVAAKHYAAQREKTAPPTRSKAAARSASKPAEQRDAEPATHVKSGSTRKPAVAHAKSVDPPRRAGKGKRNTRKARKRLAAKLAAKPARRGAVAKTAEVESKPTAKTMAKVAAKTTAKATAKVAAKTTAKAVTKTTAPAKAKAKTAKIAKTAAKPPKATAATTPAAKTATKPAAKPARPKIKEETTMGKRSGKGASCGCMTWTEAEGKARGEAKHGAFIIEPEGKKHALYFYDPEGQSRHVQSGDAGKLRKVAEEMAARGQPAPRATSAGDDGALLKMFMTGAMEDES